MAKKMQTERSWIFLRGLGREQRHWGPFLETFQKQFPQDRIECLDIAGNGDQSNRQSFLSIRENVQDLRGRSRLLKESGSVSLLSVSLGGMMALEWGRLYPDEVERIVLINTSNRESSHFFERLRPTTYWPLLSLALKTKSPELMEAVILRLTTNLLPDLKAQAVAQAKYKIVSAENFFRQLFAAWRFSLQEAPKAPMLFLISARDFLVNPNCSRSLARKWHAPTKEHPLAGHDLTLDDPEWVAKEVAAWVGAGRE